MAGSGKTSIYTLGKELGVSPATVSRALKMSPSISLEMREKVRKAAEKRNFKPRLVSSRPTALYALIQQVKGHPLDFDSYMARSLEGIAEYCREEGLEMGIFSSDVESLNSCDIVRELRKRGADAAVLLCATKESSYVFDLERQKFPHCCLLNSPDANSPSLIKFDNRKLAKEAVSHLISLGHKRIGLAATSLLNPAHAERLEGYFDALDEAGIPRDAKLVASGDEIRDAKLAGSLAVGLDCFKRLWSAAPDISAVFSINEQAARAILGWLYAQGIAVPERLSIVAFDDFPDTEYLCPSLSAVSIPYKRIAYEGAKQAHRLARGLEPFIQESDKASLQGRLVVRRSSGPAGRRGGIL